MIVQHCQTKDGRNRCGRLAVAWVRRTWESHGGATFNRIEASCDRHVGDDEVVEALDQRWTA